MWIALWLACSTPDPVATPEPPPVPLPVVETTFPDPGLNLAAEAVRDLHERQLVQWMNRLNSGRTLTVEGPWGEDLQRIADARQTPERFDLLWTQWNQRLVAQRIPFRVIAATYGETLSLRVYRVLFEAQAGDHTVQFGLRIDPLRTVETDVVQPEQAGLPSVLSLRPAKSFVLDQLWPGLDQDTPVQHELRTLLGDDTLEQLSDTAATRREVLSAANAARAAGCKLPDALPWFGLDGSMYTRLQSETCTADALAPLVAASEPLHKPLRLEGALERLLSASLQPHAHRTPQTHVPGIATALSAPQTQHVTSAWLCSTTLRDLRPLSDELARGPFAGQCPPSAAGITAALSSLSAQPVKAPPTLSNWPDGIPFGTIEAQRKTD